MIMVINGKDHQDVHTHNARNKNDKKKKVMHAEQSYRDKAGYDSR